jgi:hypothetical protein
MEYKIASLIAQLRNEFPSLRIGQIIVNACGDPYYISDEDMVLLLEKALKTGFSTR